MKARKLPTQDKRVETGPVQFGEDWTGLFIRGDNCFAYANALKAVLRGYANVFDTATVECLYSDLRRVFPDGTD